MIQTRTEKINPEDIILPSDYTPDFEQLDSLIKSIEANGLFHPPIIKESKHIVTGKLRVLAARGLFPEITCTVCPNDLDEDEYKILSLHENLKRYNLPWYEQVTQEKELHDLRQAQLGTPIPGKRKGWGLRDTANELNMALGAVSQDLRLAEAVLSDPSLKRIQDKTTAYKVISRAIKQANQSLGVSAPTSFDTDVIHHGSAEVVLRSYDNDTFDACITDPPWLEYRDERFVKDIFTLEVFKEVYRVLKANSFLYAFVSTQDWNIYFEEFQKIGFSVQKWPLIWVKEGTMNYGSRSWEYQRDYEPIMLAVKGSPALTTGGILSAVMSCKVIPSALLKHPNEKPPEPIKRILDNCSYEGSLILDPFAGSFVVPDVCAQMRRRYVAIERETRYYHVGMKRLGKTFSDKKEDNK